MNKRRAFFWTFAGMSALLLFWELGSRYFGAEILLPGPAATARRFVSLAAAQKFFAALAATFFRVMAGLLLAVPLGTAAGLACALDRRINFFLKPLFAVISATPVMAVILIAFLVLGQERTPVFTAFLMIFPVMAAGTAEGAGAVDPRYRELLRVYRVSRADALRFLYLPAVAPFILGGLRAALSLSWKVVVAAEVLVQPVRSLGTGMQLAKARLETAELYAWTAASVIAAALCQGMLSLGIKLFARRRKAAR